MYLLIPGLRTMSHTDWRKLLTSNAFAFSKPGKLHTRRDFRTIGDVQAAQDEFNRHPWDKNNNGIMMFFRAFAEVKKSQYPALDPSDYDQLYTMLFETKNTADNEPVTWQGIEHLPQTIAHIMKNFPSGSTERELQSSLMAVTSEQITKEEFRSALFQLKSIGFVDKQARTTNDRKPVTFYSPRLNAHGTFEQSTVSLQIPEIDTMLEHISMPNISQGTADVLHSLLPHLSCTTVESFRPLREYDIDYLVKQMQEDIHTKTTVEITDDMLKLYLFEVQKCCIQFGRKRGIN